MTFRFPDVVPYLYYPDATEAVEFLTRAFGFTEHSALRDDQGRGVDGSAAGSETGSSWSDQA